MLLTSFNHHLSFNSDSLQEAEEALREAPNCVLALPPCKAWGAGDWQPLLPPVAAASLGQVYRLDLPEHGRVAVKVQRRLVLSSSSEDIDMIWH